MSNKIDVNSDEYLIELIKNIKKIEFMVSNK